MVNVLLGGDNLLEQSRDRITARAAVCRGQLFPPTRVREVKRPLSRRQCLQKLMELVCESGFHGDLLSLP
jgi:hypothetical protein